MKKLPAGHQKLFRIGNAKMKPVPAPYRRPNRLSTSSRKSRLKFWLILGYCAGARRVFWNEERGRYEDSYYHGALTGVASEQGNAFALLYDIATGDQIPRIAAHFSGQIDDLVQVSPLYFGYIVEGLMQVGLVGSSTVGK